MVEKVVILGLQRVLGKGSKLRAESWVAGTTGTKAIHLDVDEGEHKDMVTLTTSTYVWSDFDIFVSLEDS